MQALTTSDYRGGGFQWPQAQEDEEDSYPLYVSTQTRSDLVLTCDCSPLVMKVRSRGSSVISGASTPGGGPFKSLSEGDLRKADAALSQVNGAMNGK
jgi:glycogen(starch) synthase